MNEFICQPGGYLSGSLRVPGDKSISHRSIMLSAIAEGTSHIEGFLCGEDSLNTMRAFQSMGVNIERYDDKLVVAGVGLHGLKASEDHLNLGNSGTAMRLLLGLLAGQKFDSCLVGDESLSSRPMSRVIDPLVSMGAAITSEPGGRAPLRVAGNQKLTAISYRLPMASAQVKSCILLAGLYAEGVTTIYEPALSRDHSERMLRGFGVEVDSTDHTIQIEGGQTLHACNIDIPADISSAAFFMVAASIADGSQIVLNHVGINPTRIGVIEILRLMGANIEIINQGEFGGEPVADVVVRSAPLHGIDIPHDLVPLAIDEFPVLFIAAACAEGTTRLFGAEELRVKESDRIQVMADGLNTLGVQATPTPDGMIIEGGQLRHGRVDAHGDHRIAMAFSVAALRANGDVHIDNCINVNTSFPGFIELAQKVGMRVNYYDPG